MFSDDGEEYDASDWKTPSTQVLTALASIVTHVEEYFDSPPMHREWDSMSAWALLQSPYVKEWMDSIPDVLKPVKRGKA